MTGEPAQMLRLTSALTARERRLQADGEGSAVNEDDQLTALREAVGSLTAAGIRCALIGGMAVGVRAGVPRATIDVDLAVVTAVPRGEVTAALVDAGFEWRGEHVHTLNFRHRNGEPVQVAFGPGFDPVVDRADPVKVGGVEVPVALRSDLVAMKQRSAQDPSPRRSKALRDLADVELLRGDVPDESEGW